MARLLPPQGAMHDQHKSRRATSRPLSFFLSRQVATRTRGAATLSDRRLNSGVGHHSVGQDVIAMTGLHRPMAEQVGQQRHLCRRMIDKARPGDGAEQMGPDMSAKCIGSPLLDLITYHMLARGCAPAVDPEASGFSTVSASQQGFAMNAEIEVDPGGHCRR